MKKLFAVMLCCILSACLFSCGTKKGDTPSGSGKPSEENKYELLCGIGEPTVGSSVINFDPKKNADLVGALGASSYRMWFTSTNTFTGWKWTEVPSDELLGSLTKSVKAMYSQHIGFLINAGVKEITGNGHFLPRVASTVGPDGDYVPRRDTNPGSDYLEFLRKVEIIWTTMAKSFPEITIWEVGNEMNHLPFINFNDGGKDATYEELSEICCDYMYYAYKGVKKGNPEAVVITPGFAPIAEYNVSDAVNPTGKKRNSSGITSIKDFFELIYGHIKSGRFPAGLKADPDPDNYFDGAAWHPYDLGNVKEGIANGNDPTDKEKFNVRNWVDLNNEIFEVMCENDDSEKKVWFTEFGLTTKESSLAETDENDRDIRIYNVRNKYYKTSDEYEKNHAWFVKQYFDAMKSGSMDYVRSCHFFRMFGSTFDFSWNGFTVLYYGMFFEPDKRLNRGFYPREKAYEIQKIYGGTGDISMYAEYDKV